MSMVNESGRRSMRTLKRTRKTPQLGQLFYCSVQEGEYFWGRLIKKIEWSYSSTQTDVDFLTYLYNYPTTEPIPPTNVDWSLQDLLIPPYFEIAGAWTLGLFVFIDQIIPISQDELTRTHYFRHPMWAYPQGAGKTLDEYENPIIPPADAVIGNLPIPNRAGLAWDIDMALGRNHLYDYFVDDDGNTVPNPNKTTN